jgi:outer membrane protein
VDYSESATRSNNPVFVFGTLLTQEQFSEKNFDVEMLNRPDPLSLFRSQFVLQQSLFNGGQNILGEKIARAGADAVKEARKQAEKTTIFETVRLYYGVQVSAKDLEVVAQHVAASREDLARAQALYDAGMVTEADRLAIQVQLTGLEEQRIRAASLLQIMKAELDHVLGEPLDSEFLLVSSLTASAQSEEGPTLADLEQTALQQQPQAIQKELEVEVARLQRKQAAFAFLPAIDFNAGWESDRVSFTGGGGTNWMVGLNLRLNVFEGLGKKARLDMASANLRRKEAERKQVEDELLLELRRAYLDREASRERVRVTEGAVEQARESHRITETRYQAGLTSVTELLRSQAAALDSEVHHLTALYEEKLAEGRLELAAGTLDKDSKVVLP